MNMLTDRLYFKETVSSPLTLLPSCDKIFDFVSALRCQDGWLAWQNHCYYVSLKKDLRTWQNARSHCISMGGDLASILSNGENSFVEGIIYQASKFAIGFALS